MLKTSVLLLIVTEAELVALIAPPPVDEVLPFAVLLESVELLMVIVPVVIAMAPPDVVALWAGVY